MELLLVKETVTLKDNRKYVLATIPFSLEDKLFWQMVEEVRERAGQEEFFWDGELRSWVVDADKVELVKEILGTYYPLSVDSKVEGIKKEIRTEIKKSAVEEDVDDWLKKPL